MYRKITTFSIDNEIKDEYQKIVGFRNMSDDLEGYMKSVIEDRKNSIGQSFEDKSPIKTITDTAKKTNLYLPDWFIEENREKEMDEYQDSLTPREQLMFMKRVEGKMERWERRAQDFEPTKEVVKQEVKPVYRPTIPEKIVQEFKAIILIPQEKRTSRQRQIYQLVARDFAGERIEEQEILAITSP